MIDAALQVEGIVGDGCGGGRIFYIEGERLLAYDPVSNESMELCRGIHMPKAISKKGCVVRVACENEIVEFELSSLTKTTIKI